MIRKLKNKLIIIEIICLVFLTAVVLAVPVVRQVFSAGGSCIVTVPTPPDNITPHISYDAGIGPLLVTALRLGKDIYIKNTSKCITSGIQATVPVNNWTYDYIKSTYYDQVKESTLVYKHLINVCAFPPCTVPAAYINGDPASKPQYQLPTNNTLTTHLFSLPLPNIGTVDMSSNINLGSNTKVAVLFIDGDLSITSNITNASQNQGVVFVVQGNINIDTSVTNIDAFLISFGNICTNYDFVAFTCSTNPPNLNALTINGSVISLGSGSISLARSLTNNANPAEKIVYQPKYLSLLKEVFGKDYNFWSEIQ